MPILTGIFYFASPENNWEERCSRMVIPYAQAIQAAGGRGDPLGRLAEPLLWWLLFMAAFYVVVVCAMVILRRQLDHERLLYPLTQVPLGMVEDEATPARIKPFLKNPSMWLGLAVPFVLHGVNALSHYYEFIGRINFAYSLPLAHDAVRFYLSTACGWDLSGQRQYHLQSVVLLFIGQPRR